MTKRKSLWRLWCKSLGEKSGSNDKESDNIAIIRTFIFVTYLVTNIAIVANAVRHWDDNRGNSTQTSRHHSGHLAQPISSALF